MEQSRRDKKLFNIYSKVGLNLHGNSNRSLSNEHGTSQTLTVSAERSLVVKGIHMVCIKLCEFISTDGEQMTAVDIWKTQILKLHSQLCTWEKDNLGPAA